MGKLYPKYEAVIYMAKLNIVVQSSIRGQESLFVFYDFLKNTKKKK